MLTEMSSKSPRALNKVQYHADRDVFKVTPRFEQSAIPCWQRCLQSHPALWTKCSLMLTEMSSKSPRALNKVQYHAGRDVFKVTPSFKQSAVSCWQRCLQSHPALWIRCSIMLKEMSSKSPSCIQWRSTCLNLNVVKTSQSQRKCKAVSEALCMSHSGLFLLAPIEIDVLLSVSV